MPATTGPLHNSGASIGIIDSAALAPFVGNTLSEALTARLPGVSVMRSSGVAGTGSRIRLRGTSGILVTQQPLLFIDGIRVEDEAQSIGVDAGGQAPSRLDDVPVENIECIYVLRGPATTARYGTDAAGGVIHVVTKGARTDSTRVHGFIEAGGVKDVGEYPANYGTCTRARAAVGQCLAEATRSWSPLEAESPFRTGPLVHAGGRVTTATTNSLSLGVNGSATIDDGALRTNEHRRYDAGATADFHPDSSLSVRGDLWFMGGRTHLPQVGNLIYSVLNSALLGSSVDDPVRRGYRNIPLSVIEQFGTEQQLRRLGGVVRARWCPLTWLSFGAVAGREDSRARDDQFDPGVRFVADGFIVSPPRFEVVAEQRGQRTSASAAATATYGSSTVRLTSEVALDYLAQTRRLVQRTLDRGDQSREIDYAFRWHNPTMTGIVGRQAVAWSDRVFVDAGVRRDVLERDFVKFENPTYPFASAAWDVVRESHDSVAGRVVSSLRLRGAYGESGDSRPHDAALEFAITVPVGSGNGSSPFAVERTRELEAGFDLGMLGNRATIGATYFSKRTSDALMRGLIPPGTGPSQPIFNLAAWHNRGNEISARARLFDARSVRADLAIVFTTLKNEVTSLGGGPPEVGNYYRLTTGYPLYGAWGQRFTVADANGDGVIVPAEVVADTGARFLGSPVPTRELGISPSLMLARAVTITALIDYRGGFRTVNSGGRLRCNAVCADLYLPNVSLVDQARAVSLSIAAAGWVEDASFVRLRELAVTWALPGTWSRAIGARSSTVVLAGRNLLTRTDYTGLDPEVSYLGQTRIDQTDLFTLPLPRTFSVRLDARW